MENEPTDYKQLYDDLRVKSESDKESLTKEIETLKGTLGERDAKISELQTYICKNLSTPENPNKVESFEDRYKKALKEM